MTIMCHVFPVERQPVKSQIEQLIKVVMYFDRKDLLTEEDHKIFNVDWEYYAKEQVVLADGKTNVMRRHLPRFWERLPAEIKLGFLVAHFNSGTDYLGNILRGMESVAGADSTRKLGKRLYALQGELREFLAEAAVNQAQANKNDEGGA